MTKIKRKLNSESGATLVMALIYMLICITIGSMIMSSGSTAMGQVHHLRAEEQSYLNVLSAAELIKSEMKGTSIIEKNTTITYEGCDLPAQTLPTTFTYPDNALTYKGDGGNEDILKKIYESQTQPHSEIFTIQAPGFSLDEVNITVSMPGLPTNDYTLLFVLTEENSSYTLTLSMPAKTEITNEMIVTHPEVNVGGSEDSILCTQIDTCETTTIAYDLGFISKGALI